MSSCNMHSRPSSAGIWEVSAREGREVLTSREIFEMALRLGARPDHALRHLRREGYVLPLFRGLYYVRSPEEIRLNTQRHDALGLFALAARAKGIGDWYFGLGTALRLNGLSYERTRVESVVSRSLYRIQGVPVGSRRFVIHKWGSKLFGFGLVRRGRYRVSDPEKTVLDLAYLDFWRTKKGHPALGLWREHARAIDWAKARRYLPHYPEGIRTAVKRWL